MTEAQWRNCTSPEALLNHLTRRASERKLRLYAVGCCRRIWHLLTDDRCQHAVNKAQDFADARATLAELEGAFRMMATVARVTGDITSQRSYPTRSVPGAAWAATRSSAWEAAWDAAWEARTAARDFVPGTDWEKERAWQATLLHDLFGNPFRPIRIDPAWLARNDGVVLQLAGLIYDEGRFGDLPILADALEEAGCARTDVLEHCRSPGPHYKGCWVVDAVLGYG
jgi:hypothetical protein